VARHVTRNFYLFKGSDVMISSSAEKQRGSLISAARTRSLPDGEPVAEQTVSELLSMKQWPAHFISKPLKQVMDLINNPSHSRGWINHSRHLRPLVDSIKKSLHLGPLKDFTVWSAFQLLEDKGNFFLPEQVCISLDY
jgi:hypothetical protein